MKKRGKSGTILEKVLFPILELGKKENTRKEEWQKWLAKEDGKRKLNNYFVCIYYGVHKGGDIGLEIKQHIQNYIAIE